jgi:hypothetical protein
MIKKTCYADQHAKNSPLTKPESFPHDLEQELEQTHLRTALVEALEENEFLRGRVI